MKNFTKSCHGFPVARLREPDGYETYTPWSRTMTGYYSLLDSLYRLRERTERSR